MDIAEFSVAMGMGGTPYIRSPLALEAKWKGELA
jgi:hypothetical protein